MPVPGKPNGSSAKSIFVKRDITSICMPLDKTKRFATTALITIVDRETVDKNTCRCLVACCKERSAAAQTSTNIETRLVSNNGNAFDLRSLALFVRSIICALNCPFRAVFIFIFAAFLCGEVRHQMKVARNRVVTRVAHLRAHGHTHLCRCSPRTVDPSAASPSQAPSANCEPRFAARSFINHHSQKIYGKRKNLMNGDCSFTARRLWRCCCWYRCRCGRRCWRCRCGGDNR